MFQLFTHILRVSTKVISLFLQSPIVYMPVIMHDNLISPPFFSHVHRGWKKAVISKQESFTTTLSLSYIDYTLINYKLCTSKIKITLLFITHYVSYFRKLKKRTLSGCRRCVALLSLKQQTGQSYIHMLTKAPSTCTFFVYLRFKSSSTLS